SAIGDADHGINMSKGFRAVSRKIKDIAVEDIGVILKTVGITLVSTVGGASGPLYGTAFIRAGAEVSGKSEIDINDFAAMLTGAEAGIKMRGRADLGDKTMIDAIEPALDAIK
ncbi:MAG TPA: dihydroxyacetone kinase subunit L, partial [Clostridiaceae bacterium]|nr:dihydroxyacetone kinase subunit L [Clostridiaceae bacterium]